MLSMRLANRAILFSDVRAALAASRASLAASRASLTACERKKNKRSGRGVGWPGAGRLVVHIENYAQVRWRWQSLGRTETSTARIGGRGTPMSSHPGEK